MDPLAAAIESVPADAASIGESVPARLTQSFESVPATHADDLLPQRSDMFSRDYWKRQATRLSTSFGKAELNAEQFLSDIGVERPSPQRRADILAGIEEGKRQLAQPPAVTESIPSELVSGITGLGPAAPALGLGTLGLAATFGLSQFLDTYGEGRVRGYSPGKSGLTAGVAGGEAAALSGAMGPAGRALEKVPLGKLESMIGAPAIKHIVAQSLVGAGLMPSMNEAVALTEKVAYRPEQSWSEYLAEVQARLPHEALVGGAAGGIFGAAGRSALPLAERLGRWSQARETAALEEAQGIRRLPRTAELAAAGQREAAAGPLAFPPVGVPAEAAETRLSSAETPLPTAEPQPTRPSAHVETPTIPAVAADEAPAYTPVPPRPAAPTSDTMERVEVAGPEKPGHVRLYRAEVPGEEPATEGRWYTTDLAEAQGYLEDQGTSSRLRVLDLPQEEAGKLRGENLPEAQRKFTAAPDREYFVPLAADARALRLPFDIEPRRALDANERLVTPLDHDFLARKFPELNTIRPGGVGLTAAAASNPQFKSAGALLDRIVKAFGLEHRFLLGGNDLAVWVIGRDYAPGMGGFSTLTDKGVHIISVSPQWMEGARGPGALAHEVGHTLMRILHDKAPAETRAALRAEYLKFLKSLEGGTLHEALARFTPITHGEVRLAIADRPLGERLGRRTEQFFSYAEWLANQFARYLEHPTTGRGLIERFFERLRAVYQRLFSQFGHEFAPNKTFAEWISTLHRPFEESIAKEPLGEGVRPERDEVQRVVGKLARLLTPEGLSASERLTFLREFREGFELTPSEAKELNDLLNPLRSGGGIDADIAKALVNALYDPTSGLDPARLIRVLRENILDDKHFVVGDPREIELPEGEEFDDRDESNYRRLLEDFERDGYPDVEKLHNELEKLPREGLEKEKLPEELRRFAERLPSRFDRAALEREIKVQLAPPVVEVRGDERIWLGPDGRELARTKAIDRGVVRTIEGIENALIHGLELREAAKDGMRTLVSKERLQEPSQAWIGKSKLAKLKLYHGTASAFERFRAPAWFTTSRKSARAYADQRAFSSGKQLQTVEVRLNLKNFASGDDIARVTGNPDALIQGGPDVYEAIEQLKKAGYDGAHFYDQDPDTGEPINAYMAFSADNIHVIERHKEFEVNPVEALPRRADGARSELGARMHRVVDELSLAELKRDAEYRWTQARLRRDLGETLDRSGWMRRMVHTAMQIAQANAHVPGMKGLIDDLNNRHQAKTAWQSRADTTLSAWDKLAKHQRELVGQVLIEETLNGKRLSKVELQQRGLESRALDVVEAIKKDFNEFLGEMEAAAVQQAVRIFSQGSAAGQLFAKGTSVAQAIADIRRDFNNMRMTPYFPIARFGDFGVSVRAARDFAWAGKQFKKGQKISVELYETGIEQRARLQALKEELGANAEVTDFETKDINLRGLRGLPPSLAEMMARNLQLTPDQLKALRELQYSLAPSTSFIKHLKKRTGIAGYSQDAMRAYAGYFQRGSNWLSRLQFEDKLEAHLAQMRESIRTLRAQGLYGGPREALVKHFEKLLNVQKHPESDLSEMRAFGFLFYLGLNAKSAVVNMTQIPLMTFPYLWHRYGIVDASAAIARAYAKVGAEGLMVIPDTFAQLRGKTPKPTHFFTSDEVAMVQQGIKAGILDQSQASMLAGWSDPPTLARLAGVHRRWRQNIRRFSLYAGWMFQQAELTNRFVTALAAHDLARRAGITNPDEAFARVKHAVDTTQFEYASWNRPDMMQGKKSALFLFSLYTQHVLHFAFGGDPAWKKWWLTAFVLGGAMGLPGAEDAFDLIDLIRKQFADVGAPTESKEEFRAWVKQQAGEYLEAVHLNTDLLFHGISRYSFGLAALQGMGVPVPSIDFSGSMSFGHLRLGPIQSPLAEPFGAPPKSTYELIGRKVADVGGPLVSLPINALVAFLDDKTPDQYKRWEKALPPAVKAIGDAWKSGPRPAPGSFEESLPWWLQAAGGYSDAQGNLTYPYDFEDPAQRAEHFLKYFNFTSTGVNKKWERSQYASKLLEFYTEKRVHLMNALAIAREQRDREGVADAFSDIRKFNETVAFPELSVTGKDIREVVHRREMTKLKREQDLPPERKFINVYRKAQEALGD